LPCEGEEPYYMPAGPADWHPLDGIFADPDAKNPFEFMYGYWKVGGYALAECKLRGTVLVKVEWEEDDGPYLMPVLGGPRLSHDTKDVDPVVRARMISLLEVLAWASK
jgi:hypothetical protein